MAASPAASGSALAHVASRLCAVPAEAAFAHLTRAEGLARWNLGLWGCVDAGEGLVSGQSLFDGSRGFARIEADRERGCIDYAVGADPAALRVRIQARVLPGASLGHPEPCCLVLLLAWRPAGMDAARWARLQHVHEAELELIQAQLETAAAAGPR